MESRDDGGRAAEISGFRSPDGVGHAGSSVKRSPTGAGLPSDRPSRDTSSLHGGVAVRFVHAHTARDSRRAQTSPISGYTRDIIFGIVKDIEIASAGIA
jgi:hypothetical protein